MFLGDRVVVGDTELCLDELTLHYSGSVRVLRIGVSGRFRTVDLGTIYWS